MIKIGITGGIGSGKSVVSALISMAGIPVYAADDESKRLIDASPDIRRKLTDLIDETIFINGKLNRRKLASIIFSDEAILKQVNDIIHPVVMLDFNVWAKKQATDYCAMETAILYETGFDREMDIILMVYAPIELRLTRAMQRDNATEADILRRMNRQLPDELIRKQADVEIINDGIHPLIPQVEHFVQLLTRE